MREREDGRYCKGMYVAECSERGDYGGYREEEVLIKEW